MVSTQPDNGIFMIIKALISPFIARFHAGHFRISLSLCSQALLWKTLSEPTEDSHAFRRLLRMLPSTAFIFLWFLALLTLVSLSLLYLLRCFFHFDMVKSEFFHNVGVNYMFAPWISWLLLLQSSPFFTPDNIFYLVLCQLSVIGNLVGALVAAKMGWKESAVCMFSLGMTHYLVLFVTLYQSLTGNNCLPAILRPVFCLFFAAPSMACLAWDSISGSFDYSAKMLFFLSLFLFMCLVSRPTLFKKSMKKFNVAWWAYSFPLTVMALASTEYAQEVKSSIAHGLMLLLSLLSVVVSLVLMVFTLLHANMLLPSDPIFSPTSTPTLV
ncbi:hypothetical protein TEA_010934 [Camellia sinensis var. sinensis]|uniref:Uncharacterized protein n=1 Tax=Camellia sinensis var. sinensis TaxID=542762 RepID=A0A4S4DHT3_CAMSN|nr:hypothetical protein TEA_010934 [Camellia sinensis var. sinensis]